MATASQLLKPRRFYGSHAPRATAATPAASTTTATPRHRHCNSNCRREQPFACCRATDFHQSLLTATARDPAVAAPLSAVAVREAEADEELQAASWLRALSFYRYPEERKFAAQVHRNMVAEEEYKELKMATLNRKLGRTDPNQRSACLVALCPAHEFAGRGGEGSKELDELFVIGGGSSSDSASSSSTSGSSAGSSSASSLRERAAVAAAGQLAVVGTLDVYAVQALQGEVLIGDSRNAAYLANVCTAKVARRRGVGQALLDSARQLAISWGVDALYVHTMAVNEIALHFYKRAGFMVEKEESSNQAHYRGRCLDGIQGLGRTVLMRDTRLHG